MDIVSIMSLVAVFAAMFALGAGIHPRRLFRELVRFGLLARARALGIALVAVPVVAISAAALFGLSQAPLAGLLLIGISPGAPLALRHARKAGGRVGKRHAGHGDTHGARPRRGDGRVSVHLSLRPPLAG